MADLKVTETPTRVAYQIGSTSQTTFAVNFPFFKTSDLDVYSGTSLKGLTSDYSITTIAADDGGFISGSVIFNTGQADTIVTIVRNITQERTTDFPPSGGFNIRELNRQLDQLTAISQDLDRKIDQKIGFKETDFDGDVVNVSESAASRANKYIGFSSTGKAIVAKEGSTTGVAGTIDSSKVPLERKINTTGGLTGGGDLNDNRTLQMAVVPNVFSQTAYTNPTLKVNDKGQITEINNGTAGTGGSDITAGAGLETGTNEAGNRTIGMIETGISDADESILGLSVKFPTRIDYNKLGQLERAIEGVEPAAGTNRVIGTGALTGGGPLSAVTQSIGMTTLFGPLTSGAANPATQGTHSNATLGIDQYGRVTSLISGTASGLGWINVADAPYNASNTGADASTAINAAIAALGPLGGVLYFPAGLFASSTPFAITDKPVHVRGAGIDVTRIEFTGVNGGFTFNMSGSASRQGGAPTNEAGHEVTVSDMTITTNKPGGVNNVALKFNNPHFKGVADPSVAIDRVAILGSTNQGFFHYGIYLDGCPHAKISNCYLDGQATNAANTVSFRGTEAAIYIVSGFNTVSGLQVTQSATETHISNCNIILNKIGIYISNPVVSGVESETVTGTSEGLYITNCGFVQNNTAINSNVLKGALGLQMTNCHLKSQVHSIFGKFEQAVISNNLFYTAPTANAGVCIHFTTVDSIKNQNQSFVINGNIFVQNGTNCYGIVIGDPASDSTLQILGAIISNNHFQWQGNQPAVLLTYNCKNITLNGNSVEGNGTNVFHNDSTFNIACSVSRRAALFVPDGAIDALIGTRVGNTPTSIPNGSIDIMPQTLTTIYDTGDLISNKVIGSAGSRTVLAIPLDKSVKWVRVGVKASMSNTNAALVPTEANPGAVLLMIKHFHSSGVHYKAGISQGSVQPDYASSDGFLNGSSGSGLDYESCAMDSAIASSQSSIGLTATSGLVRVYPGDYFGIVFGNTSGAVVGLEKGCQFWMEVIEGI
jgi:hypothetical protein